MSKKERGRIGIEKWPSRQKPTQINLEEYYSKVAISHSSQIKQTWKKKGHKPG